MTYQETLDYLYVQLPMFQKVGKSAYKEDIGNIIKLCDAIDNPQQQFKSIHIGGTNGKGSTSNLLTSVFMEAGYQVGTYTSPHYVDFRERIKVNGELISEKFIIDFVQKIKSEITDIQPSFFEITVAMAFDFFAKQKVDIAMIEVGLGGRLDSTNIIKPELSIITNISFDHQAILGNTLEKIAAEKAGIIKPNTPVVIGKTQEETEQVFIKTAAKNKSKLYFADQLFIAKKGNQNHVTIQSKDQSVTVKAPFSNHYQLENITTVHTAYQMLKDDWVLTQDHFCKGIENLQKNSPLVGRWQVLQNEPFVVLDSCHNHAGIQSFLQELSQQNKGKLHLIYGAVSDKDVASIIELFPKNAAYYLTEPQVVRKMPVEKLATFFEAFDTISTYANGKDALAQAMENAQPNDTIAAFGSIFLIADILEKA